MLPNPNLGPDPYSQRLTLLMQQRLATRRRQSLRLDHCRAKRQQACCAQRPRAAEDAGTVESAAASGVEAVPLGEEKSSEPGSACPNLSPTVQTASNSARGARTWVRLEAK